MSDEEAEGPPEHISECPQKDDPTAECKCEINGVFCRCIVCRRTFAKNEVWNHGSCPECGTVFKPMFAAYKDVTIKVHWAELQTLACWAEQYAAAYSVQAPDMLRAVYAITHELEIQHPMNSSLTMGRELGIAREKSPIIGAVGNIEPVPPKFRLQ